MMKDFYERCARLLTEGEDIVIATIIQQDGSAPRTAGTKMLIGRDGSSWGTIGGGILEGRVLQLATEVFATGRSLCETFTFTGDSVDSMDMICGGEAEVYLDLLSPRIPEYREIYSALAALQGSSRKALLVTKIVTGEESKNSLKQCLLLDDKMIGMQLADEQREQFNKGTHYRFPALVQWGEDRFLVDPVILPATVYIFGAGHVSQKMAQLTAMVGFRTIVLDDRAEFAGSQRFPWADEVIVLDSFEHCFQNLPVDLNSYLVIVTRGHRYDMVVLGQALQTEASYIGMIGSRRKRDTIYQALREQGIGDDQLARVFSPIGLDIKAETPEEIAVSIVAELIKVRAEKNGA